MSNLNTEINGESLDIAEQRKKELKQLFPGVFTETRNDQGELVETIDFERLKAELGTFSEIYDNRRERYGMEWPGKRDCLRLIQAPSRATLKPCREESVDFDTTENLFIEGDNLEVLKLLQKSYYGQVKMIYIDPPYNTGKEFIYPDNFSESLDTYLQYAGLKDSEGRTFSTNTANEGRFHTKWLNMMYPRLYLARNLLREDGVIFISIDDNEVENLRRMCDEIFGEENFVACVCWQKKYAVSNDDPGFGVMHDYILVYGRSSHFSRILLPRTDRQNSRYKNPDSDPRGEWASDNYVSNKSKSERPTLWYAIRHPKTGEDVWPDESAVWRYSKEKHRQIEKEGRLYWGPNFSYKKPRLKRYLSEIQAGITPNTWWTFEDAGHNDEAQKETGKLLGKKVFSTPKPTRLLKRILDVSSKDDDIVMDFFAGSAVFSQAVYEKNLEGNRLRFLAIQLPEKIETDSEAYQKGYRVISDIGKARIRSVGEAIHTKVETQLDLDGNSKLDLGFKVLKLYQSNFKQWQSPATDTSNEALIQQMELNVDHVDPNASQEDLLYELLLKTGFKPTERVETIEVAGHPVFSIAEGALLIHLENTITQAVIDAVLEMAPAPGQFICLDKAFHGNDQLKTNAARTFASFNQGKEGLDRLEFKTV
jgi:adenine-specific DNA-methyltransferase